MLINPQIFKKIEGNCLIRLHELKAKLPSYSAPNAYHTIMQNASPSPAQPPPTEEATDRFKPWYILIQSQLNHICQFMQRLLSFVIK